MSKRAQLTGKVFGKLTVLGRGEDYISPSGSHLLRWECLCECGNIINATTSQLKRGLSSCGCVSRREDLTGRRFGKLTVKYAVDDYVSPKGSRMSKWHCVCDCSNEIDVIGMSLKNGDTHSCGQCGTSRKTTRISIDYSGKQFGELYVLQKVEDSHPPKYLCKCSCGREITVLQKELSSGKKTHCGCKTIRKKYVPAKRLSRNYVGERIGKLTILEELESHITPNGSKQRIVKCQCDCGNVFTIRLSSALKNGKCRECLDKERRADITGKRFGKLVVLSMADDYISPSGHRLSRCKCLCDCGNITIVNNKTRYYYYCKNTRGETGHRCSFRTNLEQTELDRYVAAIISALVHDRQFEAAIQKKIGTAVNTDDLEKELDTVKGQLRQLLSIKSRLENQMDTLDVSDPHYERKILDLQRRYDDQYDKIAEAELQIEDIRKRIQTIRSEQISGENVYQLLLAFDELYSGMDELDKKELLRAIIERIDLYPEKRPDGNWIRNIVFTFPVPIQGHEVKELPLEKSTLLETVVSMTSKI